jgi:hypothetical protein
MKKTNLVLRFNDGVVDSFKSKKELVKWFKDEGVSDLKLSTDGECAETNEVVVEYSISGGVDQLLKMGGIGLCMICHNEELVEMGDECVVIGVYEITVK